MWLLSLHRNILEGHVEEGDLSFEARFHYSITCFLTVEVTCGDPFCFKSYAPNMNRQTKMLLINSASGSTTLPFTLDS